jgi:putative hydroxymethylpyrimidine transport system ATP-binding protein
VHAAGFDFGGAPLFEAPDLDLAAGSWTCLLGPSGVGKSTLLRLIAGLVEPWPGSAITCSDRAPLEGRVAYMAQQDLLLPWLSALDNVLLGARLRRLRIDAAMRERARWLLARVGLAEKLASRPAILSGGQRQRVALARTLFEARPLVLMDEPFSSLDAITRHQLQALAAELLHGATVLHVTHDPWEALRLADRLYVMAGAPAHLGDPIVPPGNPPRDVGAPGLAARHAELLALLANGKREAA